MSTTCPSLGVEVVLTPLGLSSERSQVQFPQQRLCPANVLGSRDYHHSITVTQCEVRTGEEKITHRSLAINCD